MRRLLAALPPFTADSVRARLDADTLILAADTYRFFAPGYRYPVLTVTTADLGGASSAEALYLPPDGQEDLAWDPVNERIREDTASAAANSGWGSGKDGSSRLLARGGGSDPLGGGNAALSCYSLTLADDGLSARLAFTLSREASFSAALYTADGKTVWALPETTCAAGGHSVPVALPRRHGVYTLTLTAAGQAETMKVAVR